MTATSPKKILIVNGAATFNGHGGSLNTHYSEFAAEVLCGLGHSVEVTTVDRDFDPAEEAAKVVAADAIIMQFAGWWMGQPWQLKRWVDLVFTRPEIASGDGRSRTDRTALYGTGAATTIDTGRPGPVTVFRFEIDCVCVSESLEPGRLPVDLGFVSERPGLMHSCGHDMHAATGLTLARWVTANRDALCGRIRFVFQPAEEGVRGARAMVARGLARGADYLWTQHITTSIHENEIFASAGGFLATEKIDISFHGSSEFGTAVTAAAHATLAMQAIPRHSEGASRICVGTLEADAEKARMCVEVRGAIQAVADFMSAGVRRAVESAAMLAGVTAGIEVAGRAEALLPNPTAVEMIVECAKRLPDVVITEDRTRGSDDSTLWMNAVTKDGGVAGCFHYGSRGRAGLHTSSFDPEGEFTAIPALRLSVELLLSTNRRGDA